MQLFTFREPFDRGDLVAVVHDRERQAGIHPPTVHQHRAGAALAVVAALLGAGHVQVLAQRVEQRGARVERHRVILAVDGERHRHAARHVGLGTRGEGLGRSVDRRGLGHAAGGARDRDRCPGFDDGPSSQGG